MIAHLRIRILLLAISTVYLINPRISSAQNPSPVLQDYFEMASEEKSQSRPAFLSKSHVRSNEQDSLALVALYDSTNGAFWTRNSGWLSGPVANWSGTTWSAGRLTEIALANSGLSGTIPEQIADAEMLEFLWLSTSQLGGELPEALGNLSNLKRLWLFGNQLTGSIPAELKDLQSLEHLVLWDNEMEGSIPPELNQLAKLQILDLQSNRFSGTLPKLSDLTNLEAMNLRDNQFEGQIPEDLVSLPDIISIDIAENVLSGPIPDSFKDLASIAFIDLRNNGLSGTLSLELASRLASINESEVNCTLGGNDAALCIPDTSDYRAIGLDPICELSLDASCAPVNVRIETESELSSFPRLFQNYPNPFSGNTSITFRLAEGGEVKLTITDLQGRSLRSYELGFKTLGYHSFEPDLGDLVAGSYLYRLRTGPYDIAKMMVLR